MSLPLTLGLCRDCASCSVRHVVTLSMEDAGEVYYCSVRMHETDGTERCRHYRRREVSV